MACGNNHVSRAHIDTSLIAENYLQHSAENAQQLIDEILAIMAREPTEAERGRTEQLGVAERLHAHSNTFDQTQVPPGTRLWQVQTEPVASDYNVTTGKMNVYTGSDGMPILGNVYPHVHYWENPDDPQQSGAVASLAHGSHSTPVLFGQGADYSAVVEHVKILEQAIADAALSPAEVDERVAHLREGLERRRHS